ncbi:hypothetical protein CANCADRAFT_56359 [Tortispora caseinolytica NRRL Y-17796]|uniref:NEDD8-activating enzyme E1 catalytic subunit n=1 Tax=Tortispora caseinolytica NRRL Y-17796 TaxID=767744 RepID=A0A1E4TM17_9ASCO|nr:hypothetical protein CANCADRAFT_56359 [Tortispora caseinolytica NRRL Y-17796]
MISRGPFTPAEFDEKDAESTLASFRVLVIGAGGLGCEMIKNLAVSGFKHIHVIDMDKIDLSNLNRQFLFALEDVGKPKAVVAANAVMARVPGVNITPHFCKIQDFDLAFYKQFQIVVCGLDSIDARRWINFTLYQLVDPDDPASIIPMVDGGTEGFKGQTRVILPSLSACYECSLDLLGPKKTYPICTIANTPRLPEHCIEWAYILEWPKHHPYPIDTDNIDHLNWVYQTALVRARENNIPGVTHSLTVGVVKNVIPAVASTNAVIAAACCNEAFKLATACNPVLDNYMMYMGESDVYAHSFELERRTDCPVCGSTSMTLTVGAETTLNEFIDTLRERADTNVSKPSLRTAAKNLYLQAPPQLEEATRPHLELKLSSLIEENDEIIVTDPNIPLALKISIRYS